MPREAFPVTKLLLCVESDTWSKLSARKYVSAYAYWLHTFIESTTLLHQARRRVKITFALCRSWRSWLVWFWAFLLSPTETSTTFTRVPRSVSAAHDLFTLASWLISRSVFWWKSALRALISSCFFSWQTSQRRTLVRFEKYICRARNFIFFRYRLFFNKQSLLPLHHRHATHIIVPQVLMPLLSFNYLAV